MLFANFKITRANAKKQHILKVVMVSNITQNINWSFESKGRAILVAMVHFVIMDFTYHNLTTPSSSFNTLPVAKSDLPHMKNHIF